MRNEQYLCLRRGRLHWHNAIDTIEPYCKLERFKDHPWHLRALSPTPRVQGLLDRGGHVVEIKELVWWRDGMGGMEGEAWCLCEGWFGGR
jgi:hypothetical protein